MSVLYGVRLQYVGPGLLWCPAVEPARGAAVTASIRLSRHGPRRAGPGEEIEGKTLVSYLTQQQHAYEWSRKTV